MFGKLHSPLLGLFLFLRTPILSYVCVCVCVCVWVYVCVCVCVCVYVYMYVCIYIMLIVTEHRSHISDRLV